MMIIITITKREGWMDYKKKKRDGWMDYKKKEREMNSIKDYNNRITIRERWI